MMWKFRRLAFISLLVLIMLSLMTALAASNTVPASRLDDSRTSTDVNDLKPAQCAGLNLTNIVTGSGTFGGTTQNDLILGSSGADTIMGNAALWDTSNDCIVGGGGNDNIWGDGWLLGGTGNDVCIGGPGTDTFHNCEVQIQ
jgi:hypothetical protein